jgi:glycerol kinase
MRETTALGAAIAAGLAVGLWRNFAELRDINRAGGTVFRPQMPLDKSQGLFSLWEKAVNMCKGWIGDKKSQSEAEADGEKAQTRSQTVDLSKGSGGVVANVTTTTAMKVAPPAKMVNGHGHGHGEMILSKPAPWINISGDLDEADDQDLFLELRKLEVVQRLKRMGKVRVTYI